MCRGAVKFLDCPVGLPHRLREHFGIGYVKFYVKEVRLGGARCAQEFPLGCVVLHQPFVKKLSPAPGIIEERCRAAEPTTHHSPGTGGAPRRGSRVERA